jgi:hypothetical protein
MGLHFSPPGAQAVAWHSMCTAQAPRVNAIQNAHPTRALITKKDEETSMKTTDIAFAATLVAMLLGSMAAVGSLGLRTGTDPGVPVLRLEPVVITGTKASTRMPRAATSAADPVMLPCPAPAEPARLPV